MKNLWLRSMLLGVSLALLLGGAVALAASLSVTIDQACFECWPYEGEQIEANFVEPPEEYVVTMTITGFQVGDRFESDFTVNGQWKGSSSWTWGLPPPSVWNARYILCDDPYIQDYYGEWTESMRNPDTGDSTEVSFLFAEVCEVEFVPEPGTILLLGSGLAGLAGYATLRLRSGQALRWRTRE